MSSILKALQKLERETADSQGQNDPFGAIEQLVPRKMAGRSRGLYIRNAAFMIFAVVFLGVIAWALLRHPFPVSRNTTRQASPGSEINVEPPSPAPAIEVPATPTAKTVAPGADKDSNTFTEAPPRSTKTASSAPPPTPLPQQTSAKPTASAVKDRPFVRKAPAAPPLPRKAPAKPTAPAVKDRPIARKATGESKNSIVGSPPPTASGSSSPAAAPVQTEARQSLQRSMDGSSSDGRQAAGKRLSTTPTPAAGNHDNLPVKTPDDAGMSIQALVWSAEPADRLVVVNGNILKEGDSVSGNSVDLIGEDYIIVRENGARWKLKFQLQ